MPKLIEQNGARVKTGWPILLHRYETGTLPDPADMLDCLLIVNDRADGVPRARVVVSNGASYDTVAYLTDIAASAPAAPAATPLLPVPYLPVPAPAIAAEVSRQITMLRPAAHDDAGTHAQLDNLHRRVAALEGVIDTLHHVAMARIKERT